MQDQGLAQFIKQVARLLSATRIQVEWFAFEELPAAQTVREMGSIEKLKGDRNIYKRRFGSFRVGVTLENAILVLVLVYAAHVSIPETAVWWAEITSNPLVRDVQNP